MRRLVLGAASDLALNSARAVERDGRSFLLCRTADGIFALDNRCTHQDSPLAEGRLRGNFIFCPLHGVRFDLRNGMPAGTLTTKPVRTYPVTLAGDAIEISVDDDPSPSRAIF